MTSNESQPMNPEQLKALADTAREQAKRVLHKIPLLGPVAWLMMQQSSTRYTLLSDMEWRIMPPLVLDQAKLYLRDESPLAFVSWAFLSEEAASRYRHTPHHLTASDWKSGDQVWLIDLVAPFGGAQDVLQELRGTRFPGKTIYQLAPMPQSEAKILKWEAVKRPV